MPRESAASRSEGVAVSAVPAVPSPGDEAELELKLQLQTIDNRELSCVGTVSGVREDGEIAVEIRSGDIRTMAEETEGFTCELVWKSVSYDRMQTALRTFATEDTCVSGYLYHRLLGHQVEPQVIKSQAVSDDEELRAPNLPP